MHHHTVWLALTAVSTPTAITARAQFTRAARVAWSSISGADPGSPFLKGFRSGMGDLGCVEGDLLRLAVPPALLLRADEVIE